MNKSPLLLALASTLALAFTPTASAIDRDPRADGSIDPAVAAANRRKQPVFRPTQRYYTKERVISYHFVPARRTRGTGTAFEAETIRLMGKPTSGLTGDLSRFVHAAPARTQLVIATTVETTTLAPIAEGPQGR